jgi:von Willebrand factor type A domain
MDTARSLLERLRPTTLGYSDAAALRPLAARTRTLRIGLLVTLACLVAAAAFLAPRANGRANQEIAPTTSGVLVIDVSRSIIDSEFDRIGAVLARYARQKGHVGLVLFSDVPYEVLPPGSPTSAILPILHFFTPIKGHLPPNPWDATFRAGTKISAALQLARQMLLQVHVKRGAITLISDLETASSDTVALTQELIALRHEGVRVQAIPVFQSETGIPLFKSVLGASAILPQPQPLEGEVKGLSRPSRPGLPVALLILGGLVLLALAANEHWGARLALPAGERA